MMAWYSRDRSSLRSWIIRSRLMSRSSVMLFVQLTTCHAVLKWCKGKSGQKNCGGGCGLSAKRERLPQITRTARGGVLILGREALRHFPDLIPVSRRFFFKALTRQCLPNKTGVVLALCIWAEEGHIEADARPVTHAGRSCFDVK